MTHPSRQELLLLAQERADPALASRLNAHIAMCDTCAAARAAMSLVEGALASLRPESPSPGLQRSVLKRLGLMESGSLWWTFLKNFVPVLVAGIVIVSIVAVGSGRTGGAGKIPATSLLDTEKIQGVVSGALGGFTSVVAGLFRTYVSPLVADGSSHLTLYVLFLFAGIGLVDRYIVGPMFRRRHTGWRA